MKFNVKRSEWLRGEGSRESYLLRPDGMKCCVGFFCLAAGCKPEEIEDDKEVRARHTGISSVEREIFVCLDGIRTYWASVVYDTNDLKNLSDKAREAKLIALFAQKGHEITFED